MNIGIANALGFGSLSKLVVLDTFTRANNATSLGTSETGHTWQTFSDVIGISNNQAKKITSNTTNALVALNSGVSDGIIQMDIKLSDNAGIAFRVKDANNYYLFRIYFTAAKVELLRFDAGVSTMLTSLNYSLIAGQVYNLRVVMDNSDVKCYVNNVLQISATDNVYKNETKHGIRALAADSTSTYDNFIINRL